MVRFMVSTVLLVLLLALPLSASGPVLVQSNLTCQSSRNVKTVNLAFTKAQVAGDLNVVVVGWNDDTVTVASVSDSLGNAYNIATGPLTVAGGGAGAGSLSEVIYYAANITAGANTVTVNWNGSGAAIPDLRILEYSGVSGVDAASGAAGTSTDADSGSATTTNANDLIFGTNMSHTSITASGGSGFQLRTKTWCGDIAEDKTVNTAGSYNATATMSASGTWIMQMVAFSATPTAQEGTLHLSVAFGSVNVGSTGTQTLNVQNNGQGATTISSIAFSNPVFSSPSPALPVTLQPGAVLALVVNFNPTAAQVYNATATVASNATNAASGQQAFLLSGTGSGTTPPAHSVLLAWTASTSSGVTGHNVYRGTTRGGPYTKQSSSLVTGTTWTDNAVSTGQTYYYVVTAVSASGESGYSNETSATLPTLLGIPR